MSAAGDKTPPSTTTTITNAVPAVCTPTPSGATTVPPPPRLLRSPSHESVSTELSLFSISSAASEMSRAGLRVVLPPHLARGPSPTPEARHRLQVSQQVSHTLYYSLSLSLSVSATCFTGPVTSGLLSLFCLSVCLSMSAFALLSGPLSALALQNLCICVSRLLYCKSVARVLVHVLSAVRADRKGSY